MTEALTGAKQAGAPLMHTQDLEAKDDLMLVHKPLSVGRAQELSCAANRAACVSHLGAEGSVPAEIRQNTARY